MSKWISVKDRLPGPGKRVLFSTELFVGEGYRTSANTWYRYTGLPLRNCINGDVTHWMPLPEAQKED